MSHDPINTEVRMAIFNMAGHETQLKAWAEYALGLYEHSFKKIDPELVHVLKIKARGNHGKVFEKYVVDNESTISLFSKHLGSFFDALMRATHEERMQLFEEQDEITKRFEERFQARLNKA